VSLSFLFSTFSSLALTKMMMMMLVVVVFVFDLDDEGICVELKDSTETLGDRNVFADIPWFRYILLVAERSGQPAGRAESR
jgi:hypothetical protein